MPRVLVTAFEPFGGASLNPSQRIVEELGQIRGLELRTVVLPVVFASAASQTLQAVAEFGPDFVVALGQAEGRAQITVERVAINLMDARIGDNAGVQPIDQPIAVDGPDAYFTRLPAREMVAAMSAADVPAAISLSAGAFLCNHVFYAVRHALQDTEVRSGFIHVPLIEEQSAEFPGLATLTLETEVRGIRAALAVLAS